ncbi:MAG: ribbon-helix-helix domain-containing protein [Candidatus Methanodesulfokora sp.]
MNLRLDEKVVKEVERLVRKGHFSSKTEAFTQALKLLIRHYRAEEIKRKFESIREGTEAFPSVTAAIIASHEEEDLAGQVGC